MSNVIQITKTLQRIENKLQFGDRVRLKHISTALTYKNAKLLKLGETYTVLKEYSFKKESVITLIDIHDHTGVNPKFSLIDFDFVCKGAMAIFDWSLMIRCTKCQANIDLIESKMFSIAVNAIFSSRPELLHGKLVTCPHCKNKFCISSVDF